MRDEFLIQRSGKTFVLYAGLLDEGHNRGLKSIDTELLQIPDASNGNVAITRAMVEMEDGRRFSGLGDASPENVSRNIAPHIIRQSETRAKARALRDAINVGVTALEELGEDAPEAPVPNQGYRTTGQGRGGAHAGSQTPQGASQQDNQERTRGGATKRSAGKLYMMISGGGKDKEAVEDYQTEKGKKIEQMSQKEVSNEINRLAVEGA